MLRRLRLKFVFFALFVFQSVSLSSANTYSESQLDSITYQLFLTKKYKELIRVGKEGLQNGNDFYYLRYRMGIAHYELHHYEAALANFLIAFDQNPYEETLKEYLYFSYLNTGRVEDADALAFHFNDQLKKKLKWRYSIIDYVQIGGGALVNRNKVANKNQLVGNVNQNGKSDFNGNIYYGHIGSQFSIQPRFKIPLLYQYYNTSSQAFLHTKFTDTLNAFYEPQHQINVGLEYHFKRDWFLSCIGGYYINHNDGIDAVLVNDNKLKTQIDSVFRINVTYVSLTGTLNFGKRIHKFYPKISISASNLINSFQFQVEPSVTIYPFGNVNFYSMSAVSFLSESATGRFILSQTFGSKIAGPFWLDASIKYGNLNNYISSGGFASYNSFDPIKLAINGDLNIYIKKSIFQLGYGFQIKEGIFTELLALNGGGKNEIAYLYNNHIFKLSYLCKF